MIKKYLKQIGLTELEEEIPNHILNTIVKDVFNLSSEKILRNDVQTLYFYEIPKLGPNGACSITHEKEEKPYNLASTLDLKFNTGTLRNHPQTLRLSRLYEIVKRLKKRARVDWLGIYRTVVKSNGEKVLVKEAYEGAFSRAEFPLTREFAKTSNNSTVGLSGKAVYFQDLKTYSGPYYECDSEVQSEFCVPILTPNGEIQGIIDAESFHKNHFNPAVLLEITKVAMDLGNHS